jgi:3-oxoacyl-[acyl-carrier protein] reductase
MYSLAGKRALVTGGSRGLGKAAALKLAAAGAKLIVLGRDRAALADTAAEIAAAGGQVITGACDLTKISEIEGLVPGLVDQLGGVDILVNNAGSSLRRPLLELTVDTFAADMQLKLFAALRIAQLVIPGMQQRRWGRIINVVSIGGKAPKAESAPTSVTRAAGLALTKVMSQELAQWNILVNAVCIGTIKSGQWERRHHAQAPEKSYDQFLAPYGKAVPLGRMGEAAEFAEIVGFLASEASSYVTGSAINADGGLSPVL